MVRARKSSFTSTREKLDITRKTVTDSSTPKLKSKRSTLNLFLMIKVTIYKTERQEYAGFDMEGHAGYAEAGEDIVCAGVSALVINALNSIERFTDDETSCVSDEDTGSIEFRFDGIPSHDATLLLDSMILGLEEIEDSNDYEKYIDIIFKEV